MRLSQMKHRSTWSHTQFDSRYFKLNSPLSRIKLAMNRFSKRTLNKRKRDCVKSLFTLEDEEYYSALRTNDPSYDRFDNVCYRTPIYDYDMRLENEVISNRAICSLEGNGEIFEAFKRQDSNESEIIRYDYVSRLVKTKEPYPYDYYTVWEVQPIENDALLVQNESKFDNLDYTLNRESSPNGSRAEATNNNRHRDSITWKTAIDADINVQESANEINKEGCQKSANSFFSNFEEKKKSILGVSSLNAIEGEVTPVTTNPSVSFHGFIEEKISLNDNESNLVSAEEATLCDQNEPNLNTDTFELDKCHELRNKDGVKYNFWNPRRQRALAQRAQRAQKKLANPWSTDNLSLGSNIGEDYLFDGALNDTIDDKEGDFVAKRLENGFLQCKADPLIVKSEADSETGVSEEIFQVPSKFEKQSKTSRTSFHAVIPQCFEPSFYAKGGQEVQKRKQFECDAAICRASEHNFIERVPLNSYEDDGCARNVVFHPEGTLWTYEEGKSGVLDPKLVPKHQRGNIFRRQDKSKIRKPTRRFPFDDELVWQRASIFAQNCCVFGECIQYDWARNIDSSKLDGHRMR